MSIFFFRFHNLRRAEEKRKKCCRNSNNTNMSSDTLTAPSRLLERPLNEPVDSLDEIALQIPRCSYFKCSCSPKCFAFYYKTL
ncbi:hypothetical protein KGM_209673 [Danaus plexippus plexippus]|uniref:Uncharacterized protein n=1 Tax=Danaus plexippus plexippus TaxID=278856 RepID=A0A212EY17_DANPL|nr:hypothetical protein KGM_209673 [Danaus plexippus plexippus]